VGVNGPWQSAGGKERPHSPFRKSTPCLPVKRNGDVAAGAQAGACIAERTDCADYPFALSGRIVASCNSVQAVFGVRRCALDIAPAAFDRSVWLPGGQELRSPAESRIRASELADDATRCVSAQGDPSSVSWGSSRRTPTNGGRKGGIGGQTSGDLFPSLAGLPATPCWQRSTGSPRRSCSRSLPAWHASPGQPPQFRENGGLLPSAERT